jgi:hypothetical protein
MWTRPIVRQPVSRAASTAASAGSPVASTRAYRRWLARSSSQPNVISAMAPAKTSAMTGSQGMSIGDLGLNYGYT